MRRRWIVAAIAVGVMIGAADADTTGLTSTLATSPNAFFVSVPLHVTPAPAPSCLPGWTLVDVASQHPRPDNVHKCAAVGDLRDPE